LSDYGPISTTDDTGPLVLWCGGRLQDLYCSNKEWQ